MLEATATGRACVATAVDGSREVIRDGIDGLLVAAGDSAAMADRIVTLIENEELRTNMGRSAADRTRRRFNVDRMIDRWSALFERVVPTPAGSYRG